MLRSRGCCSHVSHQLWSVSWSLPPPVVRRPSSSWSLLRPVLLKKTTTLPVNTWSFSRGLSNVVFRIKPFASPTYLARIFGKDGIPPGRYQLVYRTDFDNYLLGAQVMVLTGVLASVGYLLAALLDSMKTDEERAAEEVEKQAIYDQVMKEKVAQKEEMGKKIAESGLAREGVSAEIDELARNRPSWEQFAREDRDGVLVALGFGIVLVISVTKLIRMIPHRIYIGRKGHCVSVYHASIIPTQTIKKEFVAGTLTPMKGRWGNAGIAFKDPAGNHMILLEQYFRRPSDYHYILGNLDSFDVDEEGADDKLKDIGSFANPERAKSSSSGSRFK